MPEGEPCPYCAYLAANPEELRQHLLHLHPEVEPGAGLVGPRRRGAATALVRTAAW